MSSREQNNQDQDTCNNNGKQRPPQNSPAPPSLSTTDASMAVEMAYLLLDDCYSGFRVQRKQQSPSLSTSPTGTGSINNNISVSPIFHEWIPVKIIPKSIPETNVSLNPKPQQQRQPKQGIDKKRRIADGSGCCRCHLVVTHDSETKEFSIDLNHVAPFNGMMDDIQCGDSCCCTQRGEDGCCHHGSHSGHTSTHLGYTPQKQQRSDAALLMGLFTACHSHVHIVRCFIMMVSPHHPSLLKNDITVDVDENNYYGSILVTLSFPKLHLSTILDDDDMNHAHFRRSIVADTTTYTMNRMNSFSVQANRTANIIKTKPLYPALQLLLTLIRSDWDQYEVRKEQLSISLAQNPKRQKLVSFFPSSLTLSNMYQQIQQQQSYTPLIQQSELDHNDGTALGDSLCNLALLPFDILQRNIVQPYFDASTLASLRSTSRYMYYSLRSIVPGLKLKLYTHQVNSLHWMRQRETSRIRMESDCFDDNLNTTSSCNETGDLHRAITGGASVKLCTKPLSTLPLPLHSDRRRVLYIDPYSGLEILPNDISKLQQLRRNVACGGLLCDDPGLGKTITVLALILQTPPQHFPTISNQREHETNVNKESNSNYDENLFEMYWSEEISPDFREPYLLKLINEFCKMIPSAVATNFPIKEFRKFISEDTYGRKFEQFDTAVQNAIITCQVSECKDASSSSISIWRGMVEDFKRIQMNSVRKCFSNAKAKPNSRVAALVEEESRKMHLKSLMPTTGTLIVVPSVLLEHWKAQINQHVDFRYVTNKIPLVFEFQRRDAGMTVDRATILCRMNRTHTPVVFIDSGGTRPLPPAEFLAMFQIVITTTQRFVNEAKKGSFQEELERDQKNYTISSNYFDDSENSVCELLKVHWMRMVVDEGHSMANDGHNSSITFASWIKAYRRWAMTGTPTKQNATQLGQVRGLMRFLQHEFFSSRLNGDVLWKSRIAKGWKDGEVASFFRLHNLLRYLMRRHTKLNIAELPPPLFLRSKIGTSYVEANTYNTLVSAVQMNLLLTSMNGKTSGFQDSLLHRSQAKNARLALQNIRRVCTGWSRVVPTLSFRFYAETVEMAKMLKHSEDALARIKLFMTRAEQEELSTCSCCGIQISTMLLMSCCGGQICTECMDSTTNTCYLCENQFDVDELQKLQPGFVLDWRSNLESAHAHAQPIKESPTNESSIIPAIEPLIRPPQVRHRTKKPGDGHICDYDIYASDGRCIYCLEEHNFCCLLNDRWRCNVCYRTSEECPTDESKSYFLSSRLLELRKQHDRISFSPDDAAISHIMARPLKVIVFSQFRAALNFIGDRLLRKFGTACVAEFFGSHRKQELHKFTYEECCFCLLLTKDGSEGLDLSFVTNVIFLEEVFDKSLVDQVVARAWRMGANGRVTIETLVAKNTIEEVIAEQKQSLNEDSNDKMYSKNGDQQRLKSLLQSLRFIIDHQSPFQKNSFSIKQEDSFSIKQDVETKPMGGDTLKRSLPNAASEKILDQQSNRKRRMVHFVDT